MILEEELPKVCCNAARMKNSNCTLKQKSKILIQETPSMSRELPRKNKKLVLFHQTSFPETIKYRIYWNRLVTVEVNCKQTVLFWKLLYEGVPLSFDVSVFWNSALGWRESWEKYICNGLIVWAMYYIYIYIYIWSYLDW